MLSTLHTNDAPSTVTRLRDMGVPPFLITATLEAVLAQRLVRKICPNCKETFEPDDGKVPPDFDRQPGESLHRGAGCRECRQPLQALIRWQR